jgi:serine protease Do
MPGRQRTTLKRIPRDPCVRCGWRCFGLIAVAALATIPLPDVTVFGDDQTSSSQSDVRTAVRRARECVFRVECTGSKELDSTVVLSAIAIDGDGHLVTVGLRSPGDGRLCVRDSASRRFEARWVGADAYSGLAVLKIDSPIESLPQPRVEPPELGSRVFIVGNPFGLAHSVSVGNISGLERRVRVGEWTGRGLVQFTAPVFPGDSGGLLADQNGQMLGIVCTALGVPDVESDFGERRVTGIGFAIPTADVERVAVRLREGKPVERGYLGVSGEAAGQGGVQVIRVAVGSPAEAAGLKPGDVIAKVNDEPLRDFDQLALRLDRAQPGAELRLAVVRDRTQLATSVVLGARKSAAPLAERLSALSAVRSFAASDEARRVGSRNGAFDGRSLGVQTQVVTQQLAKSLGLAATEGALISSVSNGSPADRAGLRPSDLIVLVDQQQVKSPQELDERIRAASPRGTIRIDVERSGETKSLHVKLGERPARDPIEEFNWWLAPRSADRTGRTNDQLEERLRMMEQRVKELERRLRERTGPASSPKD